MRQRRKFTSEQKVEILREHLENQIKISDIAEQYGIHSTVLARLKKELFQKCMFLTEQYIIQSKIVHTTKKLFTPISAIWDKKTIVYCKCISYF